ncbi:conjugal transfer protein TraG, partial [Acinetobacter baumannii]|nr:conjugal transfer protein TraG [Acinetobacter baumannii]
KAYTDSLNNLFKDGSSFAKDIAKFEANSIQNGFTDSDSYQKVAQQMQQYAQSISNSETNAFSKTGGQASQLSMSSSLNIDGGVLSDTMSKPATEKSVGDFWASLGGNREAAVAEWKSMKDTLNGSNTLGDTK